MVAQAQSDRPAIPAGAAEFLRSTRVDDRLLVLPGAQTAFALYDGLSPQITADIAAETGQFIPYGYHHLSHAERYAARYGWAQRSLLDSDLRELRVRYVYADPRVLDAVQADAIAAKLADGRFREAYRDPGGTAVIYAFSPA
ncbi:MAG: hypothetical protein FJ029_15505 [Actinobacteria bacterium]|nr:hypothetical protein [Actinomycetota bacterium]